MDIYKNIITESFTRTLQCKCCCEHNNVSHNVNIICTKTIVPDYNAYKSNCKDKVTKLDVLWTKSTY
jgi:hypothetical protein